MFSAMAVTPFAILFVTVALSVSAAFGVTNNLAIVSAARSQIGVTVRYDHFDAQAAGGRSLGNAAVGRSAMIVYPPHTR